MERAVLLIRIENWYQNGGSVTCTLPAKENRHLNGLGKTKLGHALTLF